MSNRFRVVYFSCIMTFTLITAKVFSACGDKVILGKAIPTKTVIKYIVQKASLLKSVMTERQYNRVLSMLEEGCINSFAKDPSLVNKINPEVFISSLPIETHLPDFNLGRASNIVFL